MPAAAKHLRRRAKVYIMIDMQSIAKRQKFTKAGMLGFFLRGCRLLFAVSILSSLVVTFINVVIPQVISFAIDSVIDDVPPEGLFARFAALLGGTQWLKERIWVLALVIAGLALIMAAIQ